MTDITLGWYDGLSLEMVVAVLKIWRHLRRLTFLHFSLTTVLSFEVLYDNGNEATVVLENRSQI